MPVSLSDCAIGSRTSKVCASRRSLRTGRRRPDGTRRAEARGRVVTANDRWVAAGGYASAEERSRAWSALRRASAR